MTRKITNVYLVSKPDSSEANQLIESTLNCKLNQVQYIGVYGPSTPFKLVLADVTNWFSVARYPYYQPRMVKVAGADRLVGCQDFFGCAIFQAVGVNSATRVIGQSPRRGNTSLK